MTIFLSVARMRGGTGIRPGEAKGADDRTYSTKRDSSIMNPTFWREVEDLRVGGTGMPVVAGIWAVEWLARDGRPAGQKHSPTGRLRPMGLTNGPGGTRTSDLTLIRGAL